MLAHSLCVNVRNRFFSGTQLILMRSLSLGSLSSSFRLASPQMGDADHNCLRFSGKLWPVVADSSFSSFVGGEELSVSGDMPSFLYYEMGALGKRPFMLKDFLILRIDELLRSSLKGEWFCVVSENFSGENSNLKNDVFYSRHVFLKMVITDGSGLWCSASMNPIKIISFSILDKVNGIIWGWDSNFGENPLFLGSRLEVAADGIMVTGFTFDEDQMFDENPQRVQLLKICRINPGPVGVDAYPHFMNYKTFMSLVRSNVPCSYESMDCFHQMWGFLSYLFTNVDGYRMLECCTAGLSSRDDVRIIPGTRPHRGINGTCNGGVAIIGYKVPECLVFFYVESTNVRRSLVVETRVMTEENAGFEPELGVVFQIARGVHLEPLSREETLSRMDGIIIGMGCRVVIILDNNLAEVSSKYWNLLFGQENVDISLQFGDALNNGRIGSSAVRLVKENYLAVVDDIGGPGCIIGVKDGDCGLHKVGLVDGVGSSWTENAVWSFVCGHKPLRTCFLALGFELNSNCRAVCRV